MKEILLFAPEICCFFCVIVFLMRSLRRTPYPRQDHLTAMVLAAVALGISLFSTASRGELFAAAYRIDLFSQVFKALLTAGLLGVIYLCTELKEISRRHHPEFYLMLFSGTLGLMMLVSAAHLLSVFLSLELSSYCLYVLVALRKDEDQGLPAGLKYFLTGITASALMIFGIALLYGATGLVYLKDLQRILPGFMDRPMVVIGLLLSLSGFFFKLAVFPFHAWAPGVYQKSANPVAVYIATVSKIAAAGVLVRMLSFDGAGSPHFIHVLAILAIISMTIANIAALVQTDLKRLLAYSSIAHAGYILLGVIGGGETGRSGVIFYALSLLLMKLTAFFVIIKGLPDDEDPKIEALAGLYQRSPILALALMVSLFSLAGIPPFVGFTAKFLVFSAVMKSGYFGLVLVAMINVVISLYYYLRVLRAAYVLPCSEAAVPLHLSQTARFIAGVLILLMIGGGLYPAGFITVADAAAHGLGINF